MKKITFSIFITCFFLFSLAASTKADDTAGMLNLKNPLDNLQVPLPSSSLKKTTVTCEDLGNGKTGTCKVPYLADYIAAWFKYLVGYGALLGVIVSMIGGFLWIISEGNPQKIGEAKGWITNGIIGIVLLTTSYMILNQVNPELTQLKALNVGYVNKEEPEDETGFQDFAAEGKIADLVNGAASANALVDYNNNKIDSCAKTLIQSLDKANIPFRISTLVTGHDRYVKGTKRESAHYKGKGIDIGCRTDEQANCKALMKYIYENMRNDIGQVFFTPAIQYQWRNGSSYSKTVPGHSDHIHLGC